MSFRTRAVLLVVAVPLAACHPAPVSPSGGLTGDDQHQLNEAAASLDANTDFPANADLPANESAAP